LNFIPTIKPQEIAFDIDGVVADTFRYFVNTAQTQYGYTFDYEDITEYDFRKVIEIEDSVWETIIKRLLDNPVHCGIKPITGAVDVLTRLARKAPSLLFITARPTSEAIREWLLRQLQGVPDEKINLQATGAGANKREALLEHRVSFFVEDCLETGFMLENDGIIPIIYDQPWNRKPHPFPTVTSWKELEIMIEW
jgi:uncharacterized HAD superfamily protein